MRRTWENIINLKMSGMFSNFVKKIAEKLDGSSN